MTGITVVSRGSSFYECMADRTSKLAMERLMRIARSQYGLFTRHQAHKCGLLDGALYRRTKSGLLVPEYKNVFRFSVVAPSFNQTLLAVCLRAPGCIWASHRSAGSLWGLDDVPPDVVEVTAFVPLNPRRPETIVHCVSDMQARDTCIHCGIPSTTVHRTLVDLGAVTDADAVEAAMESALRRGITTMARLERRLDDLGGRGRRGAGVLRKVLDRREPGARPTDSGLETEFVQLLRRGRLPQPTRQHIVHDEAGRVLGSTSNTSAATSSSRSTAANTTFD